MQKPKHFSNNDSKRRKINEPSMPGMWRQEKTKPRQTGAAAMVEV
jgi:hypothetical protein